MDRSYQNDILLKVLNREEVPRPPIWLMRQAGRILPQYRAIRNNLSGFIELVQTPELAATVTVQPVDELDVDAAIIFSDILVIPEAMGLAYELIEKKGPFFPQTITSKEDVGSLIKGDEAAEKLEYVYSAIRATKDLLNDRVPLIGFAGAPWTLLSYMVEGQGSKTFSKAKKFLYQEPAAAHLLLSKLTETIIAYLNMKIQNGADVVQVFDSWAGVLDRQLYKEFCLPYLERILSGINNAPTILFCRGAWFSLDQIVKLGADAIGLDWNYNVTEVRQVVGNQTIIQGNMDPCHLYASHEAIGKEIRRICQGLGKNHIMNLGHGVYPDTPLDNVKHFINEVKQIKY